MNEDTRRTCIALAGDLFLRLLEEAHPDARPGSVSALAAQSAELVGELVNAVDGVLGYEPPS